MGVQALRVSKKSVVQYYSFFRDICSWKILVDADRLKFGGPGCVVQVDESVVTRRKYNRGRVVKEKWVLGIYDTSVRRGVVLFVCKRDRQTLVPLIRDYVLPGSTIYTDGWSAYTGLDSGRLHSYGGQPQEKFRRPNNWSLHQRSGRLLVKVKAIS
ncbi:hypothetical protein C0J52_14193 [Blattella germanica]|nr:hypothetical protein C0J52_14193 [Blattella germanica]